MGRHPDVLHYHSPHQKDSLQKKDQFIFTDYRCFPFVDIKITGVDRDDAYSNKIQTPQDPPHHFPAIEESEEEPVIQDPNIDLKINHKKPKEQV